MPIQTPHKEIESNWIQFFGNGYQGWVGSRYITGKKKLAIKTAVPDGIIIFIPIELDNTYLIVEMVNGTIGFRCDCFALYFISSLLLKSNDVQHAYLLFPVAISFSPYFARLGLISVLSMCHSLKLPVGFC